MPFNRPSPSSLLARIQAEIDVSIPGSDARLRQSVEGVIARVLAMASHEMFGFLDWNADQILPDTAEAEYLDRHGALWGISRKAATSATGTVQFNGAIGAVIPAGTVLRRGDDEQYTVDTEVTFAGVTAIVAVTASVPGAKANSAVLTKLLLATPSAGVQTEGTVQGDGIVGGTEIESDILLRGRIIERIRMPPHGGSAADYIMWMKASPGATRAWVYPNQLGLGTVVGIFVMDDKAGTIIPSAGEVADVQTYVDSMRPVTADVTIIAPTAVPLNFEIHISPSSAAIKAAIQAELEDLINRESVPGGTLYISRIREAISVAQGEFDHVLVTPNANVVRSFGEITIMGAITWDVL